MKQDGAPDVDVTKAVAELKARKRTLEAKVGAFGVNVFVFRLHLGWICASSIHLLVFILFPSELHLQLCTAH